METHSVYAGPYGHILSAVGQIDESFMFTSKTKLDSILELDSWLNERKCPDRLIILVLDDRTERVKTLMKVINSAFEVINISEPDTFTEVIDITNIDSEGLESLDGKLQGLSIVKKSILVLYLDMYAEGFGDVHLFIETYKRYTFINAYDMYNNISTNVFRIQLELEQ